MKRTIENNTSKDILKTEEIQKEKDLAKNFIAEKPNIKWTDVIGLEKVKQALVEKIILPLKFPQLFTYYHSWKKIILYGVYFLFF